MANLLIDKGNTSLNIAWADGVTLGKTFRYQGEKYLDFILSLISVQKPEKMIMISVEPLSSYDYQVLEKECEMLIVLNEDIYKKYDLPENISYDRVASIVASRYLFKNKGCTIFDFGAALTVDFLDEKGIYEEGYISLGYRNRVKAFKKFIKKSSQSEINKGTVAGMVYEIEGYISKKKENIPVFTGGDAIYFAKRMKNSIFVVCNLVLMGLAIIALKYDKKD